MDIVLIAGLWLSSDVWDDVARALGERGHRAVPVRLPGQGDGDTAATLDDQEAAVLAAVDGADGRPLVVGHSAAAGLAWLAADRRPEAVAAVAMLGGFPAEDGGPYADFFPVQDGVVPFPGWEPFEGPDAADLDEAARAAFSAAAVPVPQGVSQGVVHLRDERRFGVPVVMLCPEFSTDDARAAVEGGQSPELARVERLSYVDVDTGHWPMLTAPDLLAQVLGEVADGL